MEFYLNAEIFYLIHKIGVEDLYTAQNFLRNDIFVGGNSFLCTTWNLLTGVFLLGMTVFFVGVACFVRSLISRVLVPRVLVLVVFVAQPTNLAYLLYDVQHLAC